MNPQKRNLSQIQPRAPVLTAKRIALPDNVVLNLSKFMSFEDFRNFVRSLWPEGGESDVIEKKMWELSTHKAAVPFMNRILLDIEYNYNPWRSSEECVLINVESLLPVFCGVRPPGMVKFTSVKKLENFVSMHVNMDCCMNHQHYSCPCYVKKFRPSDPRSKLKPISEICKYQHFHHYCSKHVRYWLKYFLIPFLLAKEENGLPEEDDVVDYLYFLSHAMHF